MRYDSFIVGDLDGRAVVPQAAQQVAAGTRAWLLPSTLAFVLWGGWAAYINSQHGTAEAVRSAIAQGIASFVITIFLTFSVARLHGVLRQRFARAVLPALATVTLTGSLLVALHSLAGTPEVLATVVPPITVAALYCLYVNPPPPV
jgi:hypothetical protein